MGVSSDYCSEVTPLQNKLIDQFESVAARRRSSFWERWAKLDVEQLNKFRVRAYVLHQLVQLDEYGTEVLSFKVADAGSNTFAIAMENIAQAYRSVNDLLQSHKKDTAIIDEWLAELYLTVEPLAYAWWQLNLTPDDLAELIHMRDKTVGEEDKPLVYPGLKEASGWLVPPNTKTVSQQLDARCKLEKDLNDTLQLGNVEIVEFFVTTEPALVEQFVKEGK